MLDKEFGEHIEKKMGLSLDKIRAMSPSEMKKYLDRRGKRKVKYCRGKNLITREELNKEIDKLLGIE